MPGVYPAAPGGATNPPRKLLDQVRDALRVKHYSYRGELQGDGSQVRDNRGIRFVVVRLKLPHASCYPANLRAL